MPNARLPLLGALLALAAGGVASQARADACSDLTGAKLDHAAILHAETVDSGRFVEPADPGKIGKAHEDLPAFCRAVGVSSPTPGSHIGFEVWLPLQGWSRRLHMVGNGAYTSSIYYAQMAQRIRAHDVAVATDTGHQGSKLDFGFDNPEGVKVWAKLAVHESVVAAKQVTRAYFHSTPQWAYFSGCSTGGMQALSEVQTYPDDFDGVIAGDPGSNRTNLTLSFLWNYQHNHPPGDDAHPIIPIAKLLMVNRQVVHACDALDGVVDGVINDPRACRFDVAALHCADREADDCLTDAQVSAFKAIYAGPQDARTGRQIFPGFTLGSEGVQTEPNQRLPGWSDYWADTHHPDQPDRVDILRRWALHDPSWNWWTFDWGHDVDTVRTRLAPLMDATNPDLHGFRAHGGKLIMFMGWEDPVGAAQDAIDYYDQVTDRGAGLTLQVKRRATQSFARLFMVPGMGHCAGGPGATNMSTATRDSTPPISDARHDMALALEDWVEHGRAPEILVATHYKDDVPGGDVQFQRPLCAYPKTTKYIGGDTSKAESFTCIDRVAPHPA